MYSTKEKIKDIDSIDLEKIKRLALWLKDKKQYPLTAELYPTQKCNLNCLYCWQKGQEEPRSELETEKWVKVVKELRKIQVKTVTITGGEPLCKQGIATVLKAIKETGMKGHLVTNGTLFDEKMIKFLVDIGWDSIVFSLDSANPKINDFLRGKNSFRNVVHVIRRFNSLKKNKSSLPSMSINTVLTSKNYKSLPELVKLAHRLNIVHLAVDPLVAYHKSGPYKTYYNNSKELLIKKGQEKCLKKFLKKTGKLAREYNIPTTINDILKKGLVKKAHKKDVILKKVELAKYSFKPICIFPFISLTLREDGTISPCPQSGITGEKFEEDKGLDCLWFSETLTRFRDAMIKHKIPDCCSTCASQKVLETEKTLKVLETEKTLISRYKFINLARYYWEKKDYLKAMSYYKKVLKKKSSDFDALRGIGECNMELGNHKIAITCLKRVARQKQVTPWVMFDLGKIYYKMGKHKESIKLLKEELRSKENRSRFHTLYYLAMNYEKIGSCKKAKNLIKQAERLKNYCPVEEIAEEKEFKEMLKNGKKHRLF